MLSDRAYSLLHIFSLVIVYVQAFRMSKPLELWQLSVFVHVQKWDLQKQRNL